MMQSHDENNVQTTPRSWRERCGGLGVIVGLCLGLAVLLALRVPFVHSDPTDFPLDRNIGAATRIRSMVEQIPADQWSEAGREVLTIDQATPEFPFVPLASWTLSALGASPLVAARVFSLICSLLAAVGLFVLGRRMGSPVLGVLTVWIFAVEPLAIFMGRSLLPDGLMVTFMVWSIVAAGAGRSHKVSWPGVVAMTLLLGFAALAKLPALFFAPAAGLALVAAGGWRSKRAWIGLILSALVTYAIVCMWYRLAPWNPFPGLKSISDNTNDLLASMDDLANLNVLRVIAARVVMALTLPGALLALVGWALLQTRPDGRAWLNIWFAVGLLFVIITVKANTYWAYAFTPVGCLMIAFALAELARLGRWALIPLVVVSAAMLTFCPGVSMVRSYLAVEGKYRDLAPLAQSTLKSGRVLTYGQVPWDIEFFTLHPGLRMTQVLERDLLAQANSRSADYLLTNHRAVDPALFELFTRKPIEAGKKDSYLLFATRQPLGQPWTPDGAGTPTLMLDQLVLHRAQVSTDQAAPGQTITVSLFLSKGEHWRRPLFMSMDWRHLSTGELFPVEPASGAAFFVQWERPVLQTPDFEKTSSARMDYSFVVPSSLPSGPYALSLGLLVDPQRAKLWGDPVQTATLFEIPKDWTSDPLPLELDLKQAVQLNTDRLRRPSYGGQVREDLLVLSGSQLWLHPNLGPGSYRLEITAAGYPVGALELPESWPVLRAEQPGRSQPLTFAFTSFFSRTVTVDFEWFGPEDTLKLSILNPRVEPRYQHDFPLYLDEMSLGDRSVRLDSIRVLERD